ncbi:hypothetical protein ROZALSC1DRAFT_26175, partial [Rozella allomycis CSF55]
AAYFAAIIIGQWFTLYLCKKRFELPLTKSIFKNKYSLYGILIGALIGSFIIWTPGVQEGLGSGNVSIYCILASFGIGIIYFVLEVFRKQLQIWGYLGGLPKKNDNLIELVRTTSTI